MARGFFLGPTKAKKKEYRYTRLGRQYFAANKRAYIVEIPVNIEGVRNSGTRRGQVYSREAFIPASNYGVSRVMLDDSLSDAEKTREVKNLVLDKIDTRETSDGRIVLHEESNETWYLSNQYWRISMLETLSNGETGSHASPPSQRRYELQFFREPRVDS